MRGTHVKFSGNELPQVQGQCHRSAASIWFSGGWWTIGLILISQTIPLLAQERTNFPINSSAQLPDPNTTVSALLRCG